MSLLNPIVMAAAFDVRPDLVTPLSPESDSYKPVWGLAKTDPTSISIFANLIPYLKINSAGVVSPQNGATLSGWTSTGDIFASPTFTGIATFPDGGTWKNDGLHNTTWNAGTFAGAIAASGATLAGVGLGTPTISGATITGAVAAVGATFGSPTLSAAIINGATVSGNIAASGATLGSPTINAPTLTGVVSASGATINGATFGSPVLGIATATSINKVAITAPAASATLTIANGKTLTANNSLTLAGTDATTMTFPGTSDTVVTLAATQTLTNKTFDTGGAGNVFRINGTTISAVTGTGGTSVLGASPSLTGLLTLSQGASSAGLQVNGRSADDNAAALFYKNDASTQIGLLDVSPSQFIIKSVTGVVSFSTVGGEQLRITNTGSAVSYVAITGAASGNPPSITTNSGGLSIGSAGGTTTLSDANIKFGTYTAGIIAQAGSVSIVDSGGTTRRLLVG